jgi:hypothetical protein
LKVAFVLAALALVELHFSVVRAQGTAFTYQGRLQNNGIYANGVFNLTFTLFSAPTGGSAAAGPVTNSAVSVTNGFFTVPVDFGPGVFIGTTNWLEIAVATNGANTFSTLAPRQPLTPVPNAIFAESVNAAGLTGTYGGVSSITATNYGYVGRWVTNSYAISTNDTILFCWGTNEVLTLPLTAPFTKIFTVFSKNPNGSVVVTSGGGNQTITVPGLGQAAAVYLGGSTTPSNVLTVTFDGSNY